jgi:hypothetical protein
LIGNLASPSKLTTETTFDGKPSVEIPYARLPRIERLKVSGKIDVTEEHNLEGEGELDEEERVKRNEEKEKRKMRGKNKSLKRYLRKKRKNVIDPAAVIHRFIFSSPVLTHICMINRFQYEKSWRSKRWTKGGRWLKHWGAQSQQSHQLWTDSNGQIKLLERLALRTVFAGKISDFLYSSRTCIHNLSRP